MHLMILIVSPLPQCKVGRCCTADDVITEVCAILQRKFPPELDGE